MDLERSIGLHSGQRTLLAGAVASAAAPAMTASFGVADATAGGTLDEIMRAADGALLQAKALGRDRVVVAGEPLPELEQLPAPS